MPTITDGAIQKFKSVLEDENRQGQCIRISGKPGPSPLSVEYGLGFIETDEVQADDQVFEQDGLKFYVDPESWPLVEDATVDFVSGLNETGFKITNPKVAAGPTPTGPVSEKVQQVLESRVNPAVASHGGHVSLVDVKEHIAYLRFGGGCQGCGMVDVTLKQGVEVMLKEAIPELQGVMDVTDHAGGTNPYYQPAK